MFSTIAEKARKSISSFCIHECQAYCCKKGFLLLNEEEMKVTIGDKKETLLANEALKKTKEGTYSLHLGSKGHCPQLENNMCNIHTNPKRSSTCKDFPIFLRENTVIISDRCQAKKAGLFYPYEKAFIQAGYTLK